MKNQSSTWNLYNLFTWNIRVHSKLRVLRTLSTRDIFPLNSRLCWVSTMTRLKTEQFVFYWIIFKLLPAKTTALIQRLNTRVSNNIEDFYLKKISKTLENCIERNFENKFKTYKNEKWEYKYPSCTWQCFKPFKNWNIEQYSLQYRPSNPPSLLKCGFYSPNSDQTIIDVNIELENIENIYDEIPCYELISEETIIRNGLIWIWRSTSFTFTFTSFILFLRL